VDHKPREGGTRLFPLVERAANRWPNDVAIVRGPHSFTFRQLQSAAEKVAGQLLRLGIGSGFKVGLLCPNGPEYVIASFALFAVNAVSVPVFRGLKEPEIATLSAELGLEAYCYSPQLEHQLPTESFQHAADVALEAESGLLLRLARSLPSDSDGSDRHRLAELGAALIRFTSGTTSNAKGVILTQSGLLERTRPFAEAYSVRTGDCILDLLSMSHVFCQVTAGLAHGATLAVEDSQRIDAIARVIRQQPVTHIEATPGFYTLLLSTEDVRAEDLNRTRHLISCGAPLPERIAAAFRSRLGREIGQLYGLTETGPALINTNEGPSKRGSLGVAAPGCEIRLKSDAGSVSDELGELQVRCPGLFHGYCAPWAARETVLDDGWFCTGDVARKDADGYYWIVGRTKAMINVGAVKVFPDELERLLLAHPRVKEAFVYAAPDARFGEVPCAQIVLYPGPAITSRELARDVNRDLDVFKTLRKIDIVTAIPKTPAGKIKRAQDAGTGA